VKQKEIPCRWCEKKFLPATRLQRLCAECTAISFGKQPPPEGGHVIKKARLPE
jgi:hypothetical protein